MQELLDDDAIRAVINTALYDAFQKGMETQRLKDLEIINRYCNHWCKDKDPLACQGCPLWEKVIKK